MTTIDQPAATHLNDRELNALAVAARGVSQETAARKLDLSARQYRRHLASAAKRLDVDSTTEAIVHAVRHGWI